MDRYVAILYVRPPTPQILDFGGGFWISDFGFWILDFGFRILDFGFWISDFGFWILDFGFWILERYVAFLFVQILDFGFWILDFGFWILDFGFRILDFGFWDKFWMLHNIHLLCTPTRVGGFSSFPPKNHAPEVVIWTWQNYAIWIHGMAVIETRSMQSVSVKQGNVLSKLNESHDSAMLSVEGQKRMES